MGLIDLLMGVIFEVALGGGRRRCRGGGRPKKWRLGFNKDDDEYVGGERENVRVVYVCVFPGIDHKDQFISLLLLLFSKQGNNNN